VAPDKRGEIELFQGSGAPPAAASLVCRGVLGNENSQPRWSPDGTKFTYADASGVWVANAPVRAADGSCSITKTLIAAGGKAPDWGPANLSAPVDPGNGGASGGGTQTGGGTSSGGGTQLGGDVTTPDGDNAPPADVVAPAIAKLVLGKGKLRTLLAKGYAVSLTTNEGGTATVQLLSGKTVVATGKGRVTGGAKNTVKAKFTKRARAALKRSHRPGLGVYTTPDPGRWQVFGREFPQLAVSSRLRRGRGSCGAELSLADSSDRWSRLEHRLRQPVRAPDAPGDRAGRARPDQEAGRGGAGRRAPLRADPG
jgi:hypothetical protein